MHKLCVIKGKDPGTEHPLGDEAVLGRAGGEPVDIAIHDTKASRRHTRLVKNGGAYFLEDLGSRNGTLVNGKKVQRVRLRGGDRIVIGTTEYEYQEPQAAAPTPAPAAPAETPAVTETLSRPVKAQKKEDKPAAPLVEVRKSGRSRLERFDPAAVPAGGGARREGGLLSEDLGQRPAAFRLLVAVGALGFLLVLAGLSYWLTLLVIGRE